MGFDHFGIMMAFLRAVVKSGCGKDPENRDAGDFVYNLSQIQVSSSPSDLVSMLNVAWNQSVESYGNNEYGPYACFMELVAKKANLKERGKKQEGTVQWYPSWYFQKEDEVVSLRTWFFGEDQ